MVYDVYVRHVEKQELKSKNTCNILQQHNSRSFFWSGSFGIQGEQVQMVAMLLGGIALFVDGPNRQILRPAVEVQSQPHFAVLSTLGKSEQPESCNFFETSWIFGYCSSSFLF